ncbi:hypothetical protein UFOVP73_53 [uncultured Caudovirales phage]|uniref:Uncharacterized protein n=1 Tax=uncultured Caudovirales phage TaxID=2100421 RepID=A0A6J7WBS4_9CAUD|nr:hypothetical protein UFOVP73_53 [uncultured Caudovirales phage]CAB5194640.1 hypothetical protein UFOVP170_13 [uncultured Caudovirales phage]
MDIATHVHHEDGKTIFERSQDCAPIAEYCKARQNEGLTGSNEMRLAASIPNVMVEKYCNDNGILFSEWCANPQHIRRMLSDPALAHFRVWKGRV